MADPRLIAKWGGRSRLAGAVVCLMCMLLAGGCGNARRYSGMEMSGGKSESLITLPAVAQIGNEDCGYAAMSSVALYHHVAAGKLSDGPVPEAFRGPSLSGADLVKMAAALGLAAFAYQGDLADLDKNLAKGRPVLTLLRAPTLADTPPRWFIENVSIPVPQPHWVVVIGRAADGGIVVHDPAHGLLKMSRDNFETAWRRHKNVSVLVFPLALPASRPAGIAGK